ncbi:short-chain fatty acid transporter [Candidatus Epulonipiscium fishelsonii]|uniref:Short-chain fatty acid transporter n=1 Tax=Candidatus Epulonipiscium fishelsonii TaxID=77094 RepID=A0ACC8X9F1_9FIRM|nr:short-chain fatty acid transporter [Epulopiscium sp. SCG-B11WGA-EpuloA1]ONI42284.1 short-chain fatty acid transporter [Epulopiscium sp. SCG-B05WGA-EpuloA1]
MFKKFTNVCVNLVQKLLPDPFLFCIMITFVIFGVGIYFTEQSPFTMINHWGNGFWSLLAFSMQMALVLVLGTALANAPAVKKLLEKLAKIPQKPTHAIMLVTFVSGIACLINWGFGLVVGAVFAKEIAKQVKDVDYRLLIASAYSGFILWHAGLSGSIPLTLASGGEGVVKATMGVISAEGLATSATIFNITNIVIVLVLLFTLPFINVAMHPTKDLIVTIDPKLLEDEQVIEEETNKKMTPADRLENSVLVTLFISVIGFTYIIMYFINKGFNLNLDIVNFIFLFSGILLHKTPKRYLNALMGAAKGAGPIMLQFPFYAGIIGMMTGVTGDGASIAGLISNMFVDISNTFNFPTLAFLSAGIVNFFVPSGGGQWAVQAPIMMPAGAELGVEAAKTAMAIAWGDAWTNMLQPFWALPALGIAKLGAKDIMGYCIIVLIYSGAIISLGLLFLQ